MSERLSTLRRVAVGRFGPWWNRLVGWMEYKIDEPISNRRATEILVGGIAAGLVAGFLVIALITALVRGTIGLGHAAGQLPSGALTQIVTAPIQQWIAAHTAGLPVSPAAVLGVWLIGGAVLVLAGMAGSRGARVAWPLYGAATVTMTWFGAAEPHRPVVAGLVGLAWGLASIVVLHRGGTRKPAQHITVHTRS